MQRCEDNVAARLNGNALQPLSDVSVTVTDDRTGLKATLYSDDGITQITQPLITDDNGYYGFYAANGEYTLSFSGLRIATFTRKIVLADPSDNPYATRAELAAGSGSSLVAFMQSGTGAVPRGLDGKVRELGIFAADFTGYDPTGATDSTAAIQAAINAANANGSHTVHISGKPKITAQLTYSPALALIGTNGPMFTNRFDEAPVRVNCNVLTGYVFDMPDAVSGTGALSIHGICFDGRDANGNNSTTWKGLIKSSTTTNQCSFWLRLSHVLVGNSDSTTAILDLNGAVFPKFDNVYFSNWRYGIGVQSGLAGSLATTISFDKCYFNSLRQAAEFYDNVTDVHFNHTVIESCVVGVAALKANVTFNGGYSENMGYDPSGTGIATGLTPRSFGITDAPVIAGNVNAIFTCRYGQMIFNDYTIQNTTAGKKWFDGIGRGSAKGMGGVIALNNIYLAAGTINTVFAADTDTPSSRDSFEYHATCRPGIAFFTGSDARMLTRGRVPIAWSDGNVRPVNVDNGLFITESLASAGFASVPTSYPAAVGNVVGDIVKQAPSAMGAGKSNAWICTTAGNGTARWDTHSFVPLSVRGTAAASGGTFTVPVPLIEVGTQYVYEITAAAFGSAMSWCATVKVTQFSSGAGFSVSESTPGGVVVSYSYGNPITITNNNAGYGLTCYARLVSTGRVAA